MNLINTRGAVLLFTLSYIGISAAYLLSIGNAEFTRYLLVLTLAVMFLVAVRDHLPLSAWVLWLISLIGLMHLLGGMVRIGGDVLYAYVLFSLANPYDLTILKYDQFVHMFSSGVGALVVYAFLHETRGLSRYALALITFLAAIGIGTMNEIIEFWVSLTVPDHGVGGYFNNSLDLVFNTIGALIATIGAMAWWKTSENLK